MALVFVNTSQTPPNLQNDSVDFTTLCVGGCAVSRFTLGWADTCRFVVVREGKEAVGHTLIAVQGYTFRILELKNDIHASGLCTPKFFATDAAMLAAERLLPALDAARRRVRARGRAGPHRAQDRAEAVADRGWSWKAQSLDPQGMPSPKRYCAAFDASATANP